MFDARTGPNHNGRSAQAGQAWMRTKGLRGSAPAVQPGFELLEPRLLLSVQTTAPCEALAGLPVEAQNAIVIDIGPDQAQYLAAPASRVASPTEAIVQAVTTTLRTSRSSLVYGTSVTFTARVSAIGGKPTGTVTFMAGATPIGSAAVNGSGSATLTTKALQASASAYNVVAAYSGDGNFDGSTSNSVSETVKPASLTITVANKTKVYGAATPPLTVRYRGLVNGDTPAASVPVILGTTSASSGVGAYAIIAIAATNSNYTVHYVNGTLTITKAALRITADNKTKVYGTDNPILTATYTGLVDGDTDAVAPILLSTGATTPSSVGKYAVKVKAPIGVTSVNYRVTYVNGVLAVTPAPLTINVDDKTKVYGAPNPVMTATYNGLVNGDMSAKAPVTFKTVSANSGVGVYAITGRARNGNYSITCVDGTLTIT